jgi:hypothetical protein
VHLLLLNHPLQLPRRKILRRKLLYLKERQRSKCWRKWRPRKKRKDKKLRSLNARDF